MTNFTKITLNNRRKEIIKERRLVVGSKDLLKDPTSEYAEHHQHVINTFNDVIGILDVAIAESEYIGKGV